MDLPRSDLPRSLFFVTVFDLKKDMREVKRKNDEPFIGGRCWGFLYSLDQAKEVVFNNLTDIYENGSYNLACIEELDEGIPAVSMGRVLWYDVAAVWPENGCIQKYDVKEIVCPERFKGTCGWSLA